MKVNVKIVRLKVSGMEKRATWFYLNSFINDLWTNKNRATISSRIYTHIYIFSKTNSVDQPKWIWPINWISRMAQLKLETRNFYVDVTRFSAILFSAGWFPGSWTSGAWKRKRECCTTVYCTGEEKKVDDTREMARTLVLCLVPITDSWLAGNNPRELMEAEGSMTE